MPVGQKNHELTNTISCSFRYLHACKSVWSGLPTLYEEQNKEDVEPCIDSEYEPPGLFASSLKVKAGFTLTNPEDPRYQTASSHRKRYGEVVHRAAIVLRKSTEGEDHIDAVIAISNAIDVFLLEYAVPRGTFDSFQKGYAQAREYVEPPSYVRSTLIILFTA